MFTHQIRIVSRPKRPKSRAPFVNEPDRRESKERWISRRTNGTLVRDMAHQSFKEFVLDQLTALPEFRAKAMFGGVGLYQADCFFGILMEGRLYLRTDEQTRAVYLERGMGPFIYEKARRTMTLRYFEVPPDVLENREELVAWANRAVQVAAKQT